MKIKYYLLLNIVMMPLYAMELNDIESKGKESTNSVRELQKQASKLRISDIEAQLRTASNPHLTDKDVIPSSLKVSAYTKMPAFKQSASVGVPLLAGLEEITETHQNNNAIELTIVNSVMELMKDESKTNPMINPETIEKFEKDPALEERLRSRVTQLRDSKDPEEQKAFDSLRQYSSGREELKRKPPIRGRDSVAYDRETDEKAKALVYPLLVSILQEHAQEQKVLVEALTKQGAEQVEDSEKKLKTKNRQLLLTIIGGGIASLVSAGLGAGIAIIPELVKKCQQTP